MKLTCNTFHCMEPNEHCYEHWYEAPRYADLLYKNFDITPATYVYTVGEVFVPFDNSYCIDLETGKRAHISPGYCVEEKANTVFVIVQEPYYDMVWVDAYEKYMSHRFVTVISQDTGKLYRVLCRDTDYMSMVNNYEVNNLNIL